MGKEGIYATGRRKTAVAKVWIFPGGEGKEDINGKTAKEYFCRDDLVYKVYKPFEVTGTKGQFDIRAQLIGGGVNGQADALLLGISRALVQFNPDFKSELKKEGLLTRDPREVERKKYGHPKARKRFQYSKR